MSNVPDAPDAGEGTQRVSAEDLVRTGRIISGHMVNSHMTVIRTDGGLLKE